MINLTTQTNYFILISQLMSFLIQLDQQSPTHIEATKWLKCNNVSLLVIFKQQIICVLIKYIFSNQYFISYLGVFNKQVLVTRYLRCTFAHLIISQ